MAPLWFLRPKATPRGGRAESGAAGPGLGGPTGATGSPPAALSTRPHHRAGGAASPRLPKGMGVRLPKPFPRTPKLASQNQLFPELWGGGSGPRWSRRSTPPAAQTLAQKPWLQTVAGKGASCYLCSASMCLGFFNCEMELVTVLTSQGCFKIF